MPRGNRRFLLAALLVVWAGTVLLLLGGYVALAAFDGLDADVPRAAAMYGGGGLVVVALLYVGVGALMHDGPARP